MRLKKTWRLGAAVAAACAVGCSNGGDGGQRLSASDQGSLSVSLIDSPFTEALEIHLRITEVRVKPNGDEPALEFPFDPPLDVELLALTPDNAQTLLNEEPVPGGDYDWIELIVSADFDQELDSYVVTQVGGEEELRVPSGSVRLVSGFTVTPNQETRFTIDWDTRQGLVRPPGLPGFLLRPAFRIIDEHGTLSGTVALSTLQPAECLADDPQFDVGNVVYVFAGHDVEPDDIDQNEPNPIATIEVAQAAIDYEYSTILSPGDYTIAFTCQAANDDPETDDPTEAENDTPTVEFGEPRPITIETGEETVEHF